MDDEKTTEQPSVGAEQASEQNTSEPAEQEKPVYQKPVIRKYGQLDRVTFS